MPNVASNPYWAVAYPFVTPRRSQKDCAETNLAPVRLPSQLSHLSAFAVPTPQPISKRPESEDPSGQRVRQPFPDDTPGTVLPLNFRF